MEYCPGGDLAHLLREKKKLKEHEARLYVAEVVVAIEFLHKISVIFRDLKPGNVVLNGEGHIRLIDFGLSKDNIGYQDLATTFIGSVAYMAPEVLQRKPHTKSIDWYLTGVLLYELLVGEPPYFVDN